MLQKECCRYGYKDSSLNEIDKIESLYDNKTKLLEELIYEVKLINKERLRIYKSNVYYIIVDFCEDAQVWNSAIKNGTINGEKLDKRKKYKEKSNYDVVEKWICDIVGNTVKIYDIMSYNFKEGWNVYFEYSGDKFVIEIPIVKNVSEKSFDYHGSDCFKIKLGNCNVDHVTEIFASTFNEEELKDSLEKWLNETK